MPPAPAAPAAHAAADACSLSPAPASPADRRLPLWRTSADGECADTRPLELEALRSHLRQCSASHARLAALHGQALRLRGFVLGRLVSSAVLGVALPAAAWLLLRP